MLDRPEGGSAINAAISASTSAAVRDRNRARAELRRPLDRMRLGLRPERQQRIGRPPGAPLPMAVQVADEGALLLGRRRVDRGEDERGAMLATEVARAADLDAGMTAGALGSLDPFPHRRHGTSLR